MVTASSAESSASTFTLTERRALLIGISQYEDLPELPSPTTDVAALGTLLGDPRIGGFDVTRLVDNSLDVTAGILEELFQSAPVDSQLLVYFSGHGIADQSGDFYLALGDSKVG